MRWEQTVGSVRWRRIGPKQFGFFVRWGQFGPFVSDSPGVLVWHVG